MINTLVASFAALAALGAPGLAHAAATYGATDSVGSAHVVNNCNYPVKLCNVPATGGGQDQIDEMLQPGESYRQTYMPLANDNGWSIKLSKNESLDHILQFEYTFHQDGIIWYDLSCVDGNIWDEDWKIESDGQACQPKQQAYRYSTDDAYGMQSCPQASVITVTLCTGTSVDNGEAFNSSGNASPVQQSSSSPAPPAYSAPATTSSAPPAPPAYSPSSSTTAPAAGPTPPTYGDKGAPKAPAYGQHAPPPAPAHPHKVASTFSTKTIPATTSTPPTTTDAPALDPYAVYVTEVYTAYVTADVAAYKRHEHHYGRHNREE
jgi:hypothetical protein